MWGNQLKAAKHLNKMKVQRLFRKEVHHVVEMGDSLKKDDDIVLKTHIDKSVIFEMKWFQQQLIFPERTMLIIFQKKNFLRMLRWSAIPLNLKRCQSTSQNS